MQEIYSMILNLGVTTVIVIIFLYEYIEGIKEKKKLKESNPLNGEFCKKSSESLEKIEQHEKEIAEHEKEIVQYEEEMKWILKEISEDIKFSKRVDK